MLIDELSQRSVPESSDGLRNRIQAVVRRAKPFVPWPAKVITKLVLSKLPVSWTVWHSLGFFRHGDMDSPSHATAVVRHHLDLAQQYSSVPDRFTALEIGPGNSQLSALAMSSLGAEKVIYIDRGVMSETPQALLDAMKVELSKIPANAPDAKAPEIKMPEVSFFGGGTEDFESLEPESVDVIWSKDVLEHIYSDELARLFHAQSRSLTSGGVAVHSVDFGDHLSGGLVSTYFPDRVWESRWFRQSGFYTNRMPFEDLVEVARTANFSVTVIDQLPFSRTPFRKRLVQQRFKRHYSTVTPTRRATLILQHADSSI
jgi:SAM-dependent methyltransferase